MVKVSLRFVAIIIFIFVQSSLSYLINTNIECETDIAYEGRFKFLNNKAEAYWHLEKDNVYFEYYFPSTNWIGIAASNQYINNKDNFCVDCYHQNQDVSHCLSQCLGDNYFIATSKGDNDPNISWNILEFKLNDNNNKNQYDQFQIANKLQSVWGIKGRQNSNYNLEKVIINNTEYIHGSWKRELILNQENKWIQPINNFDDVCWTIIASKINNSNARISQNGYFVDKDLVEIHCKIGQKKICEQDKTEIIIPHFSMQITDQHVCQENKNKNLSLIILMDTSLSINDYFDKSKLWILSLLQNTSKLFEYNKNINLRLRTSLITFDHSPKLIWNLEELNNLNINKLSDDIENMKLNINERLSGSHFKDTLQFTVNNIFPNLNKNDINIVLMLSDGKPSSCYNDHDQNPCQLAPNHISKSFQDNNIKFLIIKMDHQQNKQNIKQSHSSIKQTFECLYKDRTEIDNSIIIKPTYFNLDNLISTCYHCNDININMFPSSSISSSSYINDWNYISYRFIVNNYDIWPYYVSIKLHSECDDELDFIAKLIHYDQNLKHSILIKQSDQILKVSKNNNGNNDEYIFSFKPNLMDKLQIDQMYIIQFHLINNDNNKCHGLNKLKVINSPQTNYHDVDHYFIDISSSIDFIQNDDNINNNEQYSIPSQTDHPLVSLCITKSEKITDIATPTLAPTLLSKTNENNNNNNNNDKCRAPKYFPSPLNWNKCDSNSVEWNIDFSNWFYNKYKDETYIEYDICVLAVPPYNSCKYIDKTSKAISSILLQIPCFCEVCLNEITSNMKPKYGFTTEIHQGWIWEYILYPGQCQKYQLTLDGYVSMDYGNYKIMGHHRFIEGIIKVPNPCQPAIGYPMDYFIDNDDNNDNNHDEEINNNDDDDDDICYHDEAIYPDHECSFVCDGYENNEWKLEYISKYNQDGNTVFIYHAFVDDDIDKYECAKRQHSETQSLSKVYLRLGCDCKYQSKSFLESMTVKLEPFGVVNENYWSWNLNIEKGTIHQLKIVLKGENIDIGYSEMTLIGSDRRCTSFNKIIVPNPCKNKCNFGQFTEWTSFGQCSVECGGGYKYKTRRCVSICDAKTEIDNCYGDDNFMSPCNTHPCS